MKSRNREINIFNMSLLDILCGALGTFCFLMLTLLPYYSKAKEGGQDSQKTQEELTRTRQELAKLKAEMAKNEPADVTKLRQETEDLKKQMESAKSAATPFLVAAVEWGAPQTNFTIALEPIDAEARKRLVVSKTDYRAVLLFPNVPAGEYQMFYVPDMKVISANETLQGFMCDKESCLALPPIDVKAFQKPERVPAGKLTLTADGHGHYQKP